MTALTLEQKKAQYARQLYAYTQNQCNAVRNRTAASKVGHYQNREASRESAPEEEEDTMPTPMPESKNGQLRTGLALAAT
jgi:hypothetical protein